MVEAIASYHGFNKEEVFVGVGSDDVLAVAFMTFFNGKKPIFFPDITYSFYPVWAELFGIPYEKKAVNDAFEIQKEDYYAENGGVVFPNPNAPTGAFLSLEVVEDIIQHNQDVVVIVDEAYIDFGGTSARELVHKYDNVKRVGIMATDGTIGSKIYHKACRKAGVTPVQPSEERQADVMSLSTMISRQVRVETVQNLIVWSVNLCAKDAM